MDCFAVIDTEGSLFSQNGLCSLVATEVAAVVFKRYGDKYDLVGAHSYLLNYDLRPFSKDPKFRGQFNYLNRRFFSAYQGKLWRRNFVNPDIARQNIIELFNRYNCSDFVFAKGQRQESIWLNHPEFADGNLGCIKNLKTINELENYQIPKYDNIPNKMDILTQYLPLKNSGKDFVLATPNVNNPDLGIHTPLHEVLVFADLFMRVVKFNNHSNIDTNH